MKTHCRYRVSAGSANPLGAVSTPEGVNFALYSRHAEAVYLLLFEPGGGEPSDVIRLTGRTRFIWHGLVHGLGPGQLYAYRVAGPYDPRRGHRFNPRKLLLDPYARALSGGFNNEKGALLGYVPGGPDADLIRDDRDSAPYMPRCLVLEDGFDWQDVARPSLRPEDLVIYEVHARGFTRDPSSGVSRPGTFLGFIEKIPHLQDLGVNAVELLPVQAHYSEDSLRERGLVNYWGYNTIGFFAPHGAYGSGARPGCEVEEFKTLVRELHRAGIAVILDVVYNHTAEGNESGPTLSFRGIDNASYYSLLQEGRHAGRSYMNFTGTGNALDFGSKPVQRLCMDSLRYWAEDMRVDGFRFDLATVHGRNGKIHFNPNAPFFLALAQDPVLSRRILIAEPWDMQAYEVGGFPEEWSEWNGRFRDMSRRLLRGDAVPLEEWRLRFEASRDLYPLSNGRQPQSSVNFVTCHDGFTLNDLVSYNRRHNEANGEGNGDGSPENFSWNFGHEGPTDNPETLALRRRTARNFICLLFFSHGIPMLLGGDEMLRTQLGNNNAYCQDNPIGWMDWNLLDANRDMFEFVKGAIALRRHYPAFSSSRHWNEVGEGLAHWMTADLSPLSGPDMSDRPFGCLLGPHLHWTRGDKVLLLLNARVEEALFSLPVPGEEREWFRLVDTGLPAGEDMRPPASEEAAADINYALSSRSVALLRAARSAKRRGGEHG